jgi:hypothetical protein
MVFTARIIKVFYQNFADKKWLKPTASTTNFAVEIIARNYRFTI